MKQETRKCLLLVGIFLLFFIVANILISNMLFIFKIEITKFNMIIAYVITVILILLLLKKLGLSKYNKIKNIMLVIVLPTILILLSLFLNSKVMDFSYDGNTYHKATIGLLKEGWNPVYETASEFDNSRKNKIYIENSSSELWTDCYARATHIFQANAYALTGSIESGKAVNTLSILSLFLIIFSYLSLKLKKIIFKKIKTNHNKSAKVLKQKLLMDLINNGFHQDIIKEVLNNIDISENEEIAKKEYQKYYNKLSKKYSGKELEYKLKQKMYSLGFNIPKE